MQTFVWRPYRLETPVLPRAASHCTGKQMDTSAVDKLQLDSCKTSRISSVSLGVLILVTCLIDQTPNQRIWELHQVRLPSKKSAQKSMLSSLSRRSSDPQTLRHLQCQVSLCSRAASNPERDVQAPSPTRACTAPFKTLHALQNTRRPVVSSNPHVSHARNCASILHTESSCGSSPPAAHLLVYLPAHAHSFPKPYIPLNRVFLLPSPYTAQVERQLSARQSARQTIDREKRGEEEGEEHRRKKRSIGARGYQGLHLNATGMIGSNRAGYDSTCTPSFFRLDRMHVSGTRNAFETDMRLMHAYLAQLGR